jgi:hypothetical protein
VDSDGELVCVSHGSLSSEEVEDGASRRGVEQASVVVFTFAGEGGNGGTLLETFYCTFVAKRVLFPGEVLLGPCRFYLIAVCYCCRKLD